MNSELNIQVVPPRVSAQENAEDLHDFAAQMKAPDFVAGMLHRQSIREIEKARSFFTASLEDEHDPLLLKGMKQAVELVIQALDRGQKIRLHGDYDLDGISGAALLHLALSRLGANCEPFLPSRFEYGYGLCIPNVEKFAEEKTDLLILVDTGVTACDEIARARELGMEVLVLDHHQPGAEMPAASVLVNPCQPGCPYPEKHLAAVGVAYKFVKALYDRRDMGDAHEFLDFVVLGTLADLMPLNGENRILVRTGMKHLGHSIFPGIRALIAHSGVQLDNLRSQDISFRMVPLLNAPGRLGTPDPALQLLIASNQDQADKQIQVLQDCNTERRRIEGRIAKQAVERVQNSAVHQQQKVLVVHSSTWHLGVIGIVATRLMNQFGKPVAVVTIDEDGVAKGSARGIEGFDWHEALEYSSEYLDRWGGHKMAAGFSMNPEKMEDFIAKLQEYAVQEKFEPTAVKHVCPDFFLPLDQIDPELMTWLHRFEPFGSANPEPLFFCDEVFLNGRCRVLGNEHLQLDLGYGSANFPAIAFGLGHMHGRVMTNHQNFSIAFTPVWNFFRGHFSIQIQIQGFGFE